MGIELTNDQIFAVYQFQNWWHSKDSKQVFEISGRPGSGKSFLVRYCIDRIGLTNDEVYYLAFAGKAVSVFLKNGLPGRTIHSAIYDLKKVPKLDENGKKIFDSKGKLLTELKFELKDHIPKRIKLLVVDEGSMVSKKIAEDLLSFGIPTVVLGDLNQLPPVMGEQYFLKEPDVQLNQIMRQSEGSPIVYLANQILDNQELKFGTYKNSAVIRQNDLNDFVFNNTDQILCGTNKTRAAINNMYRIKFKNIKNLSYPHIGEKVICAKNNWDKELSGKYKGFYMTNGTTGTVYDIYKDTFNGKSMVMDFKPDYVSNGLFKNVKFSYYHMFPDMTGVPKESQYDFFYDQMEFAYALTVHKFQGSQAPNVLYIHEDFMFNPEDRKKLIYTAITRAEHSIIIAL